MCKDGLIKMETTILGNLSMKINGLILSIKIISMPLKGLYDFGALIECLVVNDV